jgi:hypothetical protein
MDPVDHTLQLSVASGFVGTVAQLIDALPEVDTQRAAVGHQLGQHRRRGWLFAAMLGSTIARSAQGLAAGAGAPWRMLTCMEERELQCPATRPLIGWRLFRVRRSESGFVLSAPLIHNPDFERFPSRTIEATCYGGDHSAPAPGCRCGLYAVIEGTLDSLSGYLIDSAHDHDPPIYAEVACTGRVFVDLRGVRAQRIEVMRLATSASLWQDAGVQAQAAAELTKRYGIEVCDLAVMPNWVLANVTPQGAPPDDAVVDLDALLLDRRLR